LNQADLRLAAVIEYLPKFMTQCKNKHTGEIAEYLRSEYEANTPDPIRVHVILRNGKEDRWNDHFFDTCWKFLPRGKSTLGDRPS
jgi:hypothetical protein